MQLAEKVKEFLRQTNLFQSDLAKKIGFSESTISQWLQGKYKGDVIELEVKISQFLDIEEEKIKNEIPKIPFVKTRVAYQLFKAARYCHTDCEIGICYGDSGLGKTTAVKKYAENNTGVVVIKAKENISNRVLVQQLYEKLGLSGQSKVHEMETAITQKLTNSGRLIIVDEAEFLKASGFTILRSIHDDTEYSFGLLFVGTHKLHNNLQSLRGDFAYLTNRVGYSFEVKKLERDDVKAIVESVIPNSEELWNYFYQKTGGNARVLSKTIYRSMRLALNHDKPVDTGMIDSSKKMLIA